MNLSTNIVTSNKTLSTKTKFISLSGLHKIMFNKGIPQYIYEYLEQKFIIYRASPFVKICECLFTNVVDFGFSENGKYMAILGDGDLSVHGRDGLVARVFDVYGAFNLYFRSDDWVLDRMSGENKNNWVDDNNNCQNKSCGILSSNERIVLTGHSQMDVYEIFEKNVPKYSAVLNKIETNALRHTFMNINIRIETNRQKIKVTSRKGTVFFYKFPEKITATCADTLLTKIFAASESGRIYVLSLAGDEMKTMEFHKQMLKVLCLNFDEQLLFTSDGSVFCVWDVKSNVLVESIECNVSVVSSVHVMDVESRVEMIIPRKLQ